jgi:hypothetical protein
MRLEEARINLSDAARQLPAGISLPEEDRPIERTGDYGR